MTQTHESTVAEPHEEHEEHELEHHPTVRQYVNVAVVLAIVTAAEVAVYYIDAVRRVLVPLLVFFAVMKFALVVLWFMHLKFDSRMFRRLFVAGLAVAVIVFAVVLVTFFFRDPAAFSSG